MRIMSMTDLCEHGTAERLREVRDAGLLNIKETNRVSRYRRGGADESSFWLERVALSGAASSRREAKRLAEVLDERERYARIAFRSGQRCGVTVVLDDGARLVGPVRAIEPESFCVVVDDGQGEWVRVRYEDIKDIGHYNREG